MEGMEDTRIDFKGQPLVDEHGSSNRGDDGTGSSFVIPSPEDLARSIFPPEGALFDDMRLGKNELLSARFRHLQNNVVGLLESYGLSTFVHLGRKTVYENWTSDQIPTSCIYETGRIWYVCCQNCKSKKIFKIIAQCQFVSPGPRNKKKYVPMEIDIPRTSIRVNKVYFHDSSCGYNHLNHLVCTGKLPYEIAVGAGCQETPTSSLFNRLLFRHIVTHNLTCYVRAAVPYVEVVQLGDNRKSRRVILKERINEEGTISGGRIIISSNHNIQQVVDGCEESSVSTLHNLIVPLKHSQVVVQVLEGEEHVALLGYGEYLSWIGRCSPYNIRRIGRCIHIQVGFSTESNSVEMEAEIGALAIEGCTLGNNYDDDLRPTNGHDLVDKVAFNQHDQLEVMNEEPTSKSDNGNNSPLLEYQKNQDLLSETKVDCLDREDNMSNLSGTRAGDVGTTQKNVGKCMTEKVNVSHCLPKESETSAGRNSCLVSLNNGDSLFDIQNDVGRNSTASESQGRKARGEGKQKKRVGNSPVVDALGKELGQIKKKKRTAVAAKDAKHSEFLGNADRSKGEDCAVECTENRGLGNSPVVDALVKELGQIKRKKRTAVAAKHAKHSEFLGNADRSKGEDCAVECTETRASLRCNRKNAETESVTDKTSTKGIDKRSKPRGEKRNFSNNSTMDRSLEKNGEEIKKTKNTEIADKVGNNNEFRGYDEPSSKDTTDSQSLGIADRSKDDNCVIKRTDHYSAVLRYIKNGDVQYMVTEYIEWDNILFASLTALGYQLVDVAGEANCGYYVSLLGLACYGKVDTPDCFQWDAMVRLRVEIKKFLLKNREEIWTNGGGIREEALGSDFAFRCGVKKSEFSQVITMTYKKNAVAEYYKDKGRIKLEDEYFEILVHGFAVAAIYKVRLVVHQMLEGDEKWMVNIVDGYNAVDGQFALYSTNISETPYWDGDSMTIPTIHMLHRRPMSDDEGEHFLFLIPPDRTL